MSVSRKNFISTLGFAAVASSVPFTKKFSPKELIKPSKLSAGSTLGLIAPASPIYKADEFSRMLSTLRGLGFKLKLGEHVRNQYGYLAGKDEDRVADLHAMFQDEEVDGILCVRGGWGCNRILPLINFEIIKNNPKVFCGFSDITSLHLAIQKHTGLVTFHGPVGKSEWNSYTWNHFRDVIFEGKKDIIELPESEKEAAHLIRGGQATGTLLGGNLTVLSATLGSNYLPPWQGAILFLEDIGESAYKIDRMLTQLKLNGILGKISGFVFGQCTECEAGENSLSLQQVFDHHIKPMGIPAFAGAMISHEDNNATLPIGIKARLNADAKTLELLEPGVE